jgi:hypothetical protein
MFAPQSSVLRRVPSLLQFHFWRIVADHELSLSTFPAGGSRQNVPRILDPLESNSRNTMHPITLILD